MRILRAYVKETSPDPSITTRSSINKRKCDWCATVSASKLKTCGKCRRSFYCGPACQRAAWPGHKQLCEAPPAVPEEGPRELARFQLRMIYGEEEATEAEEKKKKNEESVERE